MGYMNAKVGKGKDGSMARDLGLRERNERSIRLIQYCRDNQLPQQLYTWTAPNDDETQTL